MDEINQILDDLITVYASDLCHSSSSSKHLERLQSHGGFLSCLSKIQQAYLQAKQVKDAAEWLEEAHALMCKYRPAIKVDEQIILQEFEDDLEEAWRHIREQRAAEELEATTVQAWRDLLPIIDAAAYRERCEHAEHEGLNLTDLCE